jgi:hypothetical protein
MNRTMTAVAACLLLTSAAFAQDVDADTRFHRAYEQEVVDGKVADAARVYLAMMGDEKVPERLRQEAKFRFAVTAVLLGRSDEARSYLAELVRDPKTPETLRARANEYLDVAKGIGVGSELDKKLQALVFDLGRAPPMETQIPPAAYRDFEIIGRPAVPFLRQLLVHPDLSLRQHAYTILLRMNEPGMGAAWTPELETTYGAYAALCLYVIANPSESVELEKRVLAANDNALKFFLTRTGVPVSAEFLRAAAKRKVGPDALVGAASRGRTASHEQLLLDWTRSDDALFASAAALGVAKLVNWRPADWKPDPSLFEAVADRLVTTDTYWVPSNYRDGNSDAGSESYKGFLRLASAVEVGTLLDTMDAAVTRIGASTDDVAAARAGAIADAVADAVEAKQPAGADAVRYAALLRKWAAQPRARTRQDFGGSMVVHVHFALGTLPQADAEKLAVWAVTDGLNSGQYVLRGLPYEQASDIPVLLAAFRVADRQSRMELVRVMGLTADGAGPKSPTPEYAHALLAALPEITRWAADARLQLPFATFAQLALLVPADEARERLAAVVAAGKTAPDAGVRNSGLGVILATSRVGDGVDAVRYHAEIVVPSLDAVFAAVREEDRARVLVHAFGLLETSGPDANVQRSITDFLRAHLEDMPQDAGPWLAGRPAQFPLVVWVPRVKFAISTSKFAVPVEAADEAVRTLTEDPAAVVGNTMVFARDFASPQLKTETFDRMLRTAPLDRLPAVLYATFNANCNPASIDALEDALGRAVAAETPNLDVVAKLTLAVRATRPSEKLSPAVPLLLKGSQAQIIEGIQPAWAIGREEMLPLLEPLLDSMDGTVRKQAHDAIDSIVEMRRAKDEARKKAGGAPK